MADADGEAAAAGLEEAPDDDYGQDVTIILDNGSGTCKAGLSCDDKPTAVFPEVIGRPRKIWRKSLEHDVYRGLEVADVRSKLAVSNPLENGIIENFEDMECLWDYTFFDVLKVNPAKHPVLLTEPPYNPKPNREKMVEIMFEVYGVPSINISIQGVLALLGQGRTTGLVLDSGEGVTHTIPIFEGLGFNHCINRLDLAGRDLNTLLAKLLAQTGNCLTTTQDQHDVRMMKESQCYCALDPASEFAQTVPYKLTSGREVSLTEERWRCPEALFTPSMVGIEGTGVGGMVWESIFKCDIDVRKTLLSHIVLSGGSTMFPGFAERLARELKGLAPPAVHANIKIVAASDRQHAVWTGAQVFANIRSMQEDQWLTYEDYEEYGVGIIHEKLQIKS